MESNLITITRLKQSRNWGYSANSQAALWVEKKLATSRFPVVPIGTIVTGLSGGLTPRGAKYPEAGVTFIRVGNIQPHGLDLSDVVHIEPELHNGELKRCQLQPGDVLLAITGATFGKSCVVPDGLGDANINQHIVRIRVHPEINPHFLALFFNSDLGTKQSRILATGGTRPALSYKAVREALVPRPPREVQDSIADVMQSAYAARKKKLIEVHNLLSDVDALIFNKLKLFPESVKEATRFLKPISLLQKGRFDVSFNMGFHKFDPFKEQVKEIGEVVTFPKETKDPSKEPDKPFRYIDISSINIRTGRIETTEEILGRDAPSRARQIVHTGDIIISTVRPTRGATAIVPDEMDGFVCSTGFTVVHPKNGALPEYLHTAFRLSTTLEQFGRRSTGSSYPAILENDIKVTLIPSPSKELQKEIADEVTHRRVESSRLIAEAEQVVAEARARAERMILGEEAA